MKTPIRIFAVLLALLLLPVRVLANDAGLEEVIRNSCLYGETVDITEYKLTHAEFDLVFDKLRSEGKLPWFTESGYSYSYNEKTGLLVSFTPDSKDPEVYDRTLYEQKLTAFMAACITEDMTPLQIALSVHDYLIIHNIYDTTLEKNTGYDLLVNGSTVCAGYAALYMDILNRAGIPCITVTSEAMEHAWNLVQLDGSWYHVDLTWDDPSPDLYGRVEHKYFLLTDQEISAGEEPHHDWDTDITCTDTRYQNGYWRDVESAIWFENGSTSYVLRDEDWENRIYRRDEATGNETLLYHDHDHYVHTGDGKYAYVHRGLALADGRLYFGVQDAIRSMTTEGTDLRTEFQYDTRGNKRFIYGFHISGSTLQLSLGNHDYDTVSGTEVLSALAPHVHSFTETAQAPTCTESGYIASLCECGLSCESAHTPPAGHTYQTKNHKMATFFSEGYAEELCTVCGTEETRIIPKVDPVEWLRENFRVVLVVASILLVLPSLFRKKVHTR